MSLRPIEPISNTALDAAEHRPCTVSRSSELPATPHAAHRHGVDHGRSSAGPQRARSEKGKGILSGKAKSERKPGVRIDGGKRRDLNKQRVSDRLAGLPDGAPTVTQAKSRRAVAEKRERTERAAAKVGHEGARVSLVKIKLSQDRIGHQMVRAKPGTFEWRYGRNKQDALFHAGNHLAILWERAGMTIASSANFLRGTSSGYATGLADGRAQAIDKLNGFREAMGTANAANLIAYCVEGHTASNIAHRNGVNDREMATVLHHCLRQCAQHFDFM